MEESAPSIPPSIWASMNSWFTPTILFIFLNLMIATILFTSTSPSPSPNHRKPEDQNEKPQKLSRSPSILHRLRSLNLSPHRSEHHQQEEEEQTLEIAATQYVFNHPENLDTNPTRFQEQVPDPAPTPAKSDDFNRTNEKQIGNAETHFVIEPKHTVETVTTHYDFGPIGGENKSEETDQLKSLDEEGSDELQSLDEVYSSITGGGGGHVDRTKSDTIPASGDLPVKLPAKMKKSASLKSAFSHFEEEKIVEARRPATVRERRSAARAAEVEVDARADDFINKFKHQLKLQRLDSIIRYKDMVNRGSEK